MGAAGADQSEFQRSAFGLGARGQTIEVELVEFLRPEAKFDTLEALQAQMAEDCDRARAALSAARS